MGRTIQPGETTRIEYFSGGGWSKTGYTKVGTTIRTNDRDNPRITLHVEQLRRRAIRVECERNRSWDCDMGNFERDMGRQTRTITITRGDGGPLDLKVLGLDDPEPTANLRVIEPGERYELDITYSPPFPNWARRNYVELDTGVAEQPRDKIRIMARFPPRLRAEPDTFRVPLDTREPLDLVAELQWFEGPAAQILEATVNDPDLIVRIESLEDRQVVKLHVPAGYSFSRGKYKTVLLKTDDAAVPEFWIGIVPSRLRAWEWQVGRLGNPPF